MDTNNHHDPTPPTDFRAIRSRILDRAKATDRPPPTPEQRAEAERRWREREAQTAVGNLAAQLGPRYAPSRASLDSFRAPLPAQRVVVERLRGLVARLPEFVADGRPLVLYGPVGTGKDHLLAALLYAAAGRGVPARWLNGQDAYGQIRDRMDAGAPEEDYFRELAGCPLLALSDPVPPVGAPTAWNVAQLYRLVDRRYRALRPTWMSLNVASPEDADAKLSAPVFDRLRDGAELVPCFWPSFRRAAKGE